MRREKGFAYCGLACCLCEKEGCSGCESRGCPDYEVCRIPNCCKEKGIPGCYACDKSALCQNPLLKKPKLRAFNRYLAENGKQALLDRLDANEKAGIIYHKPGTIIGDYDLDEVSDILLLIEQGKDHAAN